MKVTGIPPTLLNSLIQFFKQAPRSKFDNPKRLQPRKANIQVSACKRLPSKDDYKRKAKGFSALPLGNLQGDGKHLFAGIEKIHDLVFPVILSIDGIEMGHFTDYSAYACTASTKTISKQQEKQKLNGAFLFVCPSNSGEQIQDATAEREVSMIKVDKSYSCNACQWKMGMDTSMFYFELTPTCSDRTPAESVFRGIQHAVIENIHISGKDGCFFRAVREGFNIKFGVLLIVMDLPALACTRDSSGLQNSNNPCPFCVFRTSHFDTILGAYLPTRNLLLSTTDSADRDCLKTLNSAMTSLDPRDPLRLLPIAMYIRKHDNLKVR